MQLKYAVVVASMAALLAAAAPGLARNAETQKPGEQSSCRSYQQAKDGSWTELPCQEVGSPAAPMRKATVQKPDDGIR